MIEDCLGMGFLVSLQEARMSAPQVLTDLFSAFSSSLVYEYIPIAIAGVLLWFVDKRWGEMAIFNTVMAYNAANLIKFAVAQPRPWLMDPGIQPYEGALEDAGSYSFPSAHAAIAGAGYGSVAVGTGRRWVAALMLVIVAMIAFSRMFLGVHTPLDVVAGLALCVAVMAVNHFVFKWAYRSERNFLVMEACYAVAGTAVAAGILVLMDQDARHVLMGIGFMYGMILGTALDHRFVRFEPIPVPVSKKVVFGILGLAGALAFLFVFGKVLTGPAVSMAGAFLACMWVCVVFPLVMKRFMKTPVCGPGTVRRETN